MVGGIGLVEFQHGELGIVPGREAFVAEVAVDLEDPVKAADQEPFEVEFRGDAQVEVHVQGLVVGLERLGGGAAGDRLHHRCLDLHEIEVVEVFPDQTDDLHPFAKDITALGGDNQVDITLAVTGLDIGEAVPFFRQGAQRLGNHRDRSSARTDSSPVLVLNRVPSTPTISPMSHFLKTAELLFAHGVALQVDLHLTTGVGQMAEGGLAEFAHRHDPAGDGIAGIAGFGGLRFEDFTFGQEFCNRVGRLEGVAVEIDAQRGQGLGLFPSLCQYLIVFIHGTAH